MDGEILMLHLGMSQQGIVSRGGATGPWEYATLAAAESSGDSWQDGDDVQKCIECHKTPGEAPKGKKAKKKLSKKEKIKEFHAEALHANCKGCHKAFNKKYKPKKAPTTCAKCHPKTK